MIAEILAAIGGEWHEARPGVWRSADGFLVQYVPSHDVYDVLCEVDWTPAYDMYAQTLTVTVRHLASCIRAMRSNAAAMWAVVNGTQEDE